ncbi:MAG: hypothetical protein HC788_04660, partial [Sphingopyxis sp.]|nr:hypothetical protein [Sphingopyxis sp.]
MRGFRLVLTLLTALLLGSCGDDGVSVGRAALLERERELAQAIVAAPRDAALQVA